MEELCLEITKLEPELLPSRLEGVWEFNYCTLRFLKVREKHVKNYFQAFSLAGLEGIW